ncbi:zincin-like metallopeptidase domain-containing protein [Xenorhabdus eapokensis]|uniref:Antirestriction protein n=1 Tax=Xenorhabdus eapokensis TaxID=1873482 RepID=A0A1Q5TKU7_9GAMM|nr:zincin-like metallopeptidase domain-containing protein [Xenorhabdus eapokensis]OKP00834.1 antirestriction protein [Xenorhabdus eapokensis]
MKQDYAENVTARIIAQLEQGTAPWQRPWKPGELLLPYNPTTGKKYRGMNTLWLHMQGYGDPRWMTYKQAAGEGAQVRKGEKGTHIVYWKFNEEKKVVDEHGRPILDPETGKQKTITVLLERPRSFTAVVFNAAQIDGLPSFDALPVRPEPERHMLAETILLNSGAKIQHDPGDRAFYRPISDSITLPARNQFPTADNYYATALHELGHWTGHPSRLARDLTHPFGSEGYAREELRAEIASLMLGERLNIGHDFGQHAAYVGSWIKILKEDPREIFRAAADAERISDYIMGFEHEKAQEVAVERQNEPMGLKTGRVPDQTVLHEPPENPMPSRTYLAVPYLEKNDAKARGAKWDKEAKAWYAPEGVDVALSGLDKWSTAHAHVVKAAVPEPVDRQFIAALKEAGLDIDKAHDGFSHPVADGKIHRVPTINDKAGATSGAYALHMDEQTPGGFIQNFKTGEIIHWKPEGKIGKLNAEERAQQVADAALQRKKRELQRMTEQSATAMAALILWSESTDATADNAYCKIKGIDDPAGLRVVPDHISYLGALHNIRIAKTAQEAKALRDANPDFRVFNKGDLLIPGWDIHGKLWTLQSVNPSFKSFMKGGRKHGLFTVAGTHDPQKALNELDSKSLLFMAEGYATAYTVSKLNGDAPVIVAFDSGNFNAVAKNLRWRFPHHFLLIAADNDHTASNKGNPNVGLVKAEEVAAQYGGGVVAPEFTVGDKGSDWNDLAKIKDIDTARQMFALQLTIAKATAKYIDDSKKPVKAEQDVRLPKDESTQLKTMAGNQSSPRPKRRGMDESL